MFQVLRVADRNFGIAKFNLQSSLASNDDVVGMELLFAAALDPEIKELYLSGGLLSFQDVVDSEQHNQAFANFVPGLLNHTDLPEVAASVAPREIVLAGTVNASGKTLPVETVRKVYSSANITLEPAPAWSAARLLAL